MILSILLHAPLDACKEVYFLLVSFCCTSVTHICSTSFCPSWYVLARQYPETGFHTITVQNCNRCQQVYVTAETLISLQYLKIIILDMVPSEKHQHGKKDLHNISLFYFHDLHIQKWVFLFTACLFGILNILRKLGCKKLVSEV